MDYNIYKNFQIDNNMNYHLVKTTITNEYNTNKNYKEYTYNGYDFFYDSTNNPLYGYKYITKDNDTLLSVAKLLNANLGNMLRQNNNLYLKEGQLIVYKD